MGRQPDENEKEEEKDISSLHTLLELVDKPETFLHTLLLPPIDDDELCNNNTDDKTLKNTSALHSSQIETLQGISKFLFSRLEQLACLQERVRKKQQDNEDIDEVEDCSPLSGLPELYDGSLAIEGKEETKTASTLVDMGTIWGQVDIQNNALLSRLKKSIRKLKKENSNNNESIRLLTVLSSDDDNDDGNQLNDDDDDDDSEEEEDDEEAEEEKSVETNDEHMRKIRERMDRTMNDMENSSDDNDESSGGEKDSNIKEKESDLYDQDREELNDGFFDLHEMEDFADTEEGMLPQELFNDEHNNEMNDSEKEKKHNKKKVPHLRARNGDDEEEESDDDEEFNSLRKQVEEPFDNKHQRQYRDDDDINALENMYAANSDDDDAVNMTAADFFGHGRKNPSKEYLAKVKRPNVRDVNKGKKVSFMEEEDTNEKVDSGNLGGEDRRKDDSKLDNGDDNTNRESSNDDEKTDNLLEAEKITNSQEVAQLSNHAIQAKRLNSLTEQLERDALAEKPWQMVGETKASRRPVNSLLEVTPDFEFATKMAPMITPTHSMSIEEIIKQRILSEDWDDVIPRELPDIGLNNRRNDELPEVSQEKSKLSLGELYEREYLKKAVGYDVDAIEKETEEEKAKNEMKMLFASICSKLDAFSNYHFTPRPVAEEANCKTSATPAIAMEEVLPLYLSDARAKAPEEIYEKKNGRESILRGKSEMDKSDRIRLRQSKKAARRKARKAKLADEKLISRLQPGLGLNNPYEKRKMREELQTARAHGKVMTAEMDENNPEFNSSSKFFKKIQANVEQSVQINGDNIIGNKRKGNFDATTNSHKASHFKL